MMSGFHARWVGFATLVALTASALAVEPTQRANLVERVRAARERFKPLPEDQLTKQRLELERALHDLDSTLSRASRGYAQGWKAYLHWEELTQSLAAGDKADVAVLRSVFERFRRNNNGLEMPKFLLARDKLRDYIDTLVAQRQAKLPEVYAANVDDLAKRVEAYETTPTGLNGPEIGRLVGWLQSSGQGEALAKEVQGRFDSPNVFAQASERFLGAGFNNYIDRTTPVSDNILGTALQGTARFQASQVLDTVPSANDARLNILLRGAIHSNNVGHNGPATIRTTADTSVTATKQLVVNENGVFVVPATAACRTNSTINSISARCGLVERIAWKKAGQQKGQAEAIGSSHAAARINGLVDAEATTPVGRANYEFQDKFRYPLLRRGHLPRLSVSSSNYGIGGQILQMTRDQIAAPGAPPRPSQTHDLFIQAHESFVANFSAAVIGGVELTDEALAKMMKDLTGNVPEELQITPEKEPWSITFAEHYPLAAAFDGNQAKLFLRANRFTRGRNDDGTVDTEVLGLVQISATYDIAKTDRGATLTRQGDVNVDFVGQEKLSPTQIGMKTFLRRKFSTLFKPEFVGSGLKLPGRWANAGPLQMREMKSEQGWVMVGWNQ